MPGLRRMPGRDGRCDTMAGFSGGLLSNSDTGIIYRVQAVLDTGARGLDAVIVVLRSKRDALNLL